MAEPLSQARYLFEQFTGSGAVKRLSDLPTKAEKTFEGDWLDFKAGRSSDKDIPRIWSKILGAFANNEGGVVVWGIMAAKDPTTKIDAVNSIDLVPDVYALKTRLMELRHQATDPPIANVEILELPLTVNSPEGFVVCFVPESGLKPHRSEHADKKFFLRMGDTSKECGVSILRQLFYPKRNPRVELVIERIKNPSFSLRLKPYATVVTNDLKAAFKVGFRNIGESSLDEVYARISCENYSLFTWTNSSGVHEVEALKAVTRVSEVIHPELSPFIPVALASEGSSQEFSWKVTLYARDISPRYALVSSKEIDSHTIQRVELLPAA